jgi:hypothetical protein
MVGAADWPHDQFAREQPEDRTSAVWPRLADRASIPFGRRSRPCRPSIEHGWDLQLALQSLRATLVGSRTPKGIHAGGGQSNRQVAATPTVSGSDGWSAWSATVHATPYSLVPSITMSRSHEHTRLRSPARRLTSEDPPPAGIHWAGQDSNLGATDYELWRCPGSRVFPGCSVWLSCSQLQSDRAVR